LEKKQLQNPKKRKPDGLQIWQNLLRLWLKRGCSADATAAAAAAAAAAADDDDDDDDDAVLQIKIYRMILRRGAKIYL
jgi:hypothetical protein